MRKPVSTTDSYRTVLAQAGVPELGKLMRIEAMPTRIWLAALPGDLEQVRAEVHATLGPDAEGVWVTNPCTDPTLSGTTPAPSSRWRPSGDHHQVGPSRDLYGNWMPPATPEQLRGQVEENLRQLGSDHLDVVNLRIGGGLERGTGSLADRFAALAALREEGLVRHLGISNVGPEHLTEALEIAPVVCVQNQYGLTRARGVTPAQVRLAWTLHRGPNVLAIPGTGNPAHLEENVAAGRIALSENELAQLDTNG